MVNYGGNLNFIRLKDYQDGSMHVMFLSNGRLYNRIPVCKGLIVRLTKKSYEFYKSGICEIPNFYDRFVKFRLVDILKILADDVINVVSENTKISFNNSTFDTSLLVNIEFTLGDGSKIISLADIDISRLRLIDLFVIDSSTSEKVNCLSNISLTDDKDLFRLKEYRKENKGKYEKLFHPNNGKRLFKNGLLKTKEIASGVVDYLNPFNAVDYDALSSARRNSSNPKIKMMQNFDDKFKRK